MGHVLSMDKTGSAIVNAGGRWAPLRNLALAAGAVERALNRSPNLPGIVVLHARFGTGKSMSQSYCMNKFEAFMLECRSHFSKKSFVQAILAEMEIRPARTVSDMMEQIAEELEKSTRPLMLDDVHRISSNSVIELIHDLHDMARTTIVLAGNERFPAQLRQISEQLHSRVLVWQPLQPASAEDTRKLAGFYCPGVDIAEDILAALLQRSNANARVISINLDHIREHCQKNGLKRIDLDAWGKRAFDTGETPRGADK